MKEEFVVESKVQQDRMFSRVYSKNNKMNIVDDVSIEKKKLLDSSLSSESVDIPELKLVIMSDPGSKSTPAEKSIVGDLFKSMDFNQWINSLKSRISKKSIQSIYGNEVMKNNQDIKRNN